MIVRMIGLGGLLALMRMVDTSEQDAVACIQWPNDEEGQIHQIRLIGNDTNEVPEVSSSGD